jgi:alpha-tubulin suppressor-like RCC1 family protein
MILICEEAEQAPSLICEEAEQGPSKFKHVTTCPHAGAVSVAAGNGHSCALLEDGQVNCWGNNDHGQLGTGDWANKLIPTPVTGLDAGVAVNLTLGFCGLYILAPV